MASDEPLEERTPEERFVSLRDVVETRLFRNRRHHEEYDWQETLNFLVEAYLALGREEQLKGNLLQKEL